jgi:hypothetical protein
MGYAYPKQTGNRNYMFNKPVNIINKTYKYGGTNLSLEVLRRLVSTLWKMSPLLKRRKVVYSKQIGRPASYCTKVLLLWLVILSVFITQIFCLFLLRLSV